VHVFVLCLDGTFYEGVPEVMRRLGPWQGNRRGAVEALKPEYRLALARRLLTGEVRARGVQPEDVKGNRLRLSESISITKPRAAVPEVLLCRPQRPDGEKDKAIELCLSVSLCLLEPSEPSQSKSRRRELSKSPHRLQIRAAW
jgi:hypothetical protein